MLDQLDAQSPDALLALIKMHAQDPREADVDLLGAAERKRLVAQVGGGDRL